MFQLLSILDIYMLCRIFCLSSLREVIAAFGKAEKYETWRFESSGRWRILFVPIWVFDEFARDSNVYKEAIKHTMGFVDVAFQQSFYGVRVGWIWLQNIMLLTLREVFRSWGGGRLGCGWIGWLV